MREHSRRALERILGISTSESGPPLEKAAFDNFALVLAQAPGLRTWTREEKEDLVRNHPRQSQADEMLYLHLTQRHGRLLIAGCRMGDCGLRALSTAALGGARAGFVLAGMATELFGLALAVRSHLVLGGRRVTPFVAPSPVCRLSRKSPQSSAFSSSSGSVCGRRFGADQFGLGESAQRRPCHAGGALA
jgi:hypothetical protein